MKNLKNIVLMSILIIYEEMFFSFFIFSTVNNVFYKVIFSIIFSIFLNLIFENLKGKISKFIKTFFVIIIPLIFCSQFIYYQIYKSIISFYSFTNGGQVFQFWATILEIIKLNYTKVLLLLYPIIVYIYLCITKKKIKKKFKIKVVRSKDKMDEIEKVLKYEKTKDYSKYKVNNDSTYEENIGIQSNSQDNQKKNGFKRLKQFFIYVGIIIILQMSVLVNIYIKSDNNETGDMYSTYNLYTKAQVPTLLVDKFGLLTTMRLDLQRLLIKSEDNTLMAVSNSFEEIDTEKIPQYNMVNIDWNKIIEEENNETLKKMHEYFSIQEPSQKNEYTGMFEGKNVVVFVAEAFNEVAIDENITPTLYKLYSEGFQFKNFYTPLFPVSTADGEYIADTSLIPKENVWSISKISNNYMPYSYANVFESLGYTSQSYHNHSAKYYDRDKYLVGMGYDSYLARGTGLEERMDCSKWPNSDLEMINVTTEDYINDEKFLAYYMTVSGHLEYNTMGNYIANKNWDLVKDLPYSDKAKCYMATQIELDKAVELLIKKLEEAGKLEDTVIIISGDHYPYGLTLNELNELSSYKKDDNFEKHRMPFLIWNSGMKEPVEVEKVGCSLDILPTVLNLFGVEYDSRLLMGTDLLSNSDGMVIFSNRSFITNKGRYNSLTKEFTSLIDSNEEKIDSKEYIDNVSKIIYNKYQMSRMILENDYYRVLWDKVNK